MKRKLKIIFTAFLLIVFCIIGLLRYGLRLDDDDNGVADLILSTDLFSLIMTMDLDDDGYFDVRIYKGWDIKHKKVVVLNKNFKGMKIVEFNNDGTICTITDHRTCKKSDITTGDNSNEYHYMLHGASWFSAIGYGGVKGKLKKAK
jgi:hypothetical protein